MERNGPFGRVTNSAQDDRSRRPLPRSLADEGDAQPPAAPWAGVVQLHDDLLAGSVPARGTLPAEARPTMPQADAADEDGSRIAPADRDRLRCPGDAMRPSQLERDGPGLAPTASGEQQASRDGEAAHGASLTGRGGDVDTNGDIVDELVQRLRRAVGPFIADDVDADEQVALALAGVRVRR